MKSCILCNEPFRKGGVSFHVIPGGVRRSQWLNTLNLPNNTAKYSWVCRNHFKRTDFEDTPHKNKSLKKNALPRLFHEIDKDESDNTNSSTISALSTEDINSDGERLPLNLLQSTHSSTQAVTEADINSPRFSQSAAETDINSPRSSQSAAETDINSPRSSQSATEADINSPRSSQSVFGSIRQSSSNSENSYEILEEPWNKIPSDKHVEWMKVMGRPKITIPNKYRRVCSDHFTADNFCHIANRKILKKDSIPSLKLGYNMYQFNLPKPIVNDIEEEQIECSISYSPVNEDIELMEFPEIDLKTIHNYCKVANPEDENKKTKIELRRCQRKLYVCQKTSLKRQKKIITQRQVILELKKQLSLTTKALYSAEKRISLLSKVKIIKPE